MDTNTTTIVIIGLFVLIVVAVVLVYRSKSRINVKGPLGLGLEIDASNPEPAVPTQPAIKIKDATSTAGGLMAEDSTGRGVEVEHVRTKDDILISSQPPQDPKAQPPK